MSNGVFISDNFDLRNEFVFDWSLVIEGCLRAKSEKWEYFFKILIYGFFESYITFVN